MYMLFKIIRTFLYIWAIWRAIEEANKANTNRELGFTIWWSLVGLFLTTMFVLGFEL